MGALESKPLQITSEIYKEASRCYTLVEMQQMESDFHSHAETCQSSRSLYLPFHRFKALVCQEGVVAEQLFCLVSAQRGRVGFDDLLRCKMMLERSGMAQLERAVCSFFTAAKSTTTRERVGELVEACLAEVLGVAAGGQQTEDGEEKKTEKAEDKEKGYVRREEGGGWVCGPIRDAIMAALPSSPDTGVSTSGGSDIISSAAVLEWLRQVPSVVHWVSSLLQRPEDVHLSVGVPKLVMPVGKISEHTLLGAPLAWVLGGMLQDHQRNEWNLLFSSKVHGTSYTTFIARCTNRGPSVLLIRDTTGAVFGGFAADPWKVCPDFFGSFHTFLFQVSPRIGLFRPSGKNSNFQWCATNYQTVTNGIGFGGSKQFWGLWIQPDLASGTSQPCNTFDSPCLSPNTTFEVDTLECWEVCPPVRADPYNDTESSGSVLDRFKEEREVLKMAGVGSVGCSDDIRSS